MNIKPLSNKVLTGPATKSPGGILLLVKVKEVTASGIVYDAESILQTEAAKHHLETLREVESGSAKEITSSEMRAEIEALGAEMKQAIAAGRAAIAEGRERRAKEPGASKESETAKD